MKRSHHRSLASLCDIKVVAQTGAVTWPGPASEEADEEVG